MNSQVNVLAIQLVSTYTADIFYFNSSQSLQSSSSFNHKNVKNNII